MITNLQRRDFAGTLIYRHRTGFTSLTASKSNETNKRDTIGTLQGRILPHGILERSAEENIWIEEEFRVGRSKPNNIKVMRSTRWMGNVARLGKRDILQNLRQCT
jgi:hypothetical protein